MRRIDQSAAPSWHSALISSAARAQRSCDPWRHVHAHYAYQRQLCSTAARATFPGTSGRRVPLVGTTAGAAAARTASLAAARSGGAGQK